MIDWLLGRDETVILEPWQLRQAIEFTEREADPDQAVIVSRTVIPAWKVRREQVIAALRQR